jgi:DNA-binding winged helix-turn-helix (wHTH) protein/TolB-like protein
MAELGDVVRFGPFELNRTQKLLFRDGELVALTPKAFDMLDLFVRNAGSMMEKDALMRGVWPDTFVDEANLSHHVFMLRRALGDDREGNRFIETIPRRGYRFVAPLLEEPETVVVIDDTIRQQIVVQKDEPRRPRRALLIAMAAAAAVAIAVALLWLNGRSEKASPVRSLAILPFKALRTGTADDQLGLGLADALITRLSNLDDVVIRPTGAIARYRGADSDLPAIGKQLGVDAILDGSVQRSGDRLRLTVQLVRVRDHRSLWAETFDEPFTDIFAMEDAVSHKVADALSPRLSPAHRQQMEKRYTSNSRAYERYLEGRYLWSQATPASLDASISRFSEAIATDPKFALADAGLAEAHNSLATWSFRPSRLSYAEAEAAASKALALDPNLGAAHVAMGRVAYRHRWDMPAAERHFRRALALNPNNFEARLALGEYLVVSGRFAEARNELELAAQLDPASLQVRMQRAIGKYFSRDYADAVRESEDILKFDPQFVVAYGILWASARELGLHDKAVNARLTDLRLNGYPDPALATLRRAFTTGGVDAYRRAEIAMLQSQPNPNYDVIIFLAMNYALVGDREAAFRWLDRACEERSGWLPEMAVDPVWDGLRTDGRFAALQARVRRAG